VARARSRQIRNDSNRRQPNPQSYHLGADIPQLHGVRFVSSANRAGTDGGWGLTNMFPLWYNTGALWVVHGATRVASVSPRRSFFVGDGGLTKVFFVRYNTGIPQFGVERRGL